MYALAIDSFVFGPAGGKPNSGLPNSSGFLSYQTYQYWNALGEWRGGGGGGVHMSVVD